MLERMPEQHSMLELFLHASPAPRSEAIYRIRPVVIDTTFLVTDLLKATRCGQGGCPNLPHAIGAWSQTGQDKRRVRGATSWAPRTSTSIR